MYVCMYVRNCHVVKNVMPSLSFFVVKIPRLLWGPPPIFSQIETGVFGVVHLEQEPFLNQRDQQGAQFWGLRSLSSVDLHHRLQPFVNLICVPLLCSPLFGSWPLFSSTRSTSCWFLFVKLRFQLLTSRQPASRRPAQHS